MREYTVNDVKLRHLSLVSQTKPDFAKIMSDVFGYKNTLWDKIYGFKYKSKAIYKVFKEISDIDISRVELKPNLLIKHPDNIDNISFQARLEISNLQGTKGSVFDAIVNVIAMACYSTQYGLDYDSDTVLFQKFKQYIYDQPLIDMMGLYNHLDKAISTSSEFWNRQFTQVEVFDKDYEEAGGSGIMGGFNLLKTTKKLQNDFGVNYKESFLLPYSLVQMNNLEVACANYLQDRMRLIKERNMKMERNKK